MTFAKAGMTIFELLVVMLIIGIVYSIGFISFKKETFLTSSIKPSEIKSTLMALEYQGRIRLICDESCQDCSVLNSKNEKIASLRLISKTPLQRYGFDRYGELRPLGKSISNIDNQLIQTCFEYSINADGTSTPLIVKDQTSYFLYGPLQGEKPFITTSAEKLKMVLFNEANYPVSSDLYYAN